MTHARSRLMLGAGLAALLVCSATVGAGAAGLIGSKDIRDDSIKSVDIKNGTLAGRDVKDGSLSVRDFGDTLPSTEVATWSGTYTSDGSTGGTTPVVISTDTVPANSLLGGMKFTVTADDSTCTRNFLVWVAPQSLAADGQLFIAARSVHKAEETVIETSYGEVTSSPDSAEPMAILAACADDSGDISVPSFDFTVKFSITQLDSSSPMTFN